MHETPPGRVLVRAVALALGCGFAGSNAHAQQETWLVDGARGASSEELQLAIDQAAPGASIVLRGGEYAGIRIDKSLLLLGQGGARLTWPPGRASAPAAAALEIQAGAGDRVVLSGLSIDGQTAPAEALRAAPGVRARGLGCLVLLGCSVRGQSRPPGLEAGPGAGGGSAVEFFGGEIWMSECHLEGGSAGAHQSEPDSGASGCGGAALEACGAKALILRSVLRGGNGGELWMRSGLMLLERAALLGGRGGIGVRAAEIIRAGADIRGGSGGSVRHGARLTWQLPSGRDVEGRCVDYSLHSLCAAPAGSDQRSMLIVQHEPEDFLWLVTATALRGGIARWRAAFTTVLAGGSLGAIEAHALSSRIVAPGIVESRLDLARRPWKLPAGIPLLVQPLRLTRAGELRWLNPEILLLLPPPE